MKGKYGLKALLHLARLDQDEVVQSSEIAEENHISKKFLDTILADLRIAGFVAARKGRNGGYQLLRPPGEIRIGHVLRVIDGPLAPLPCASRLAYQKCNDCGEEETCSVRLLMLEVREAIVSVLDHRTLAEMSLLGQSLDRADPHKTRSAPRR